LKGVLMARRCVSFACAIFLVLMISQRSNSQQQSQPSVASGAAAAQKFAALSDQFMKDSLSWSPVSASAAGYHLHMDPRSGRAIAEDALLDDFSPQSFATQREFYADWREHFHKETPQSAARVRSHSEL
jgi:leucyl aminopeptidase (aminopeptidase T)